jgi:8-oxo-dGTP pyrophosphatase MutT (NUDIX family)
MIMEPPYNELRLPISVNGVVLQGDRVLLLKNERDEWELPDGKLELGESPEECVRREIDEEVGWQTVPGRLLNAWVYEIRSDRLVSVICYGCRPSHSAATQDVVVSHEHREARMFPTDEVAALNMPAGYKAAITMWVEELSSQANGD